MKKQIVFLTVLVFTIILVAWNKPRSFTDNHEVRAFNMKDIKSNNVKFIVAKKTGMTNVTAHGSNEASDMACWPDDCPGKG